MSKNDSNVVDGAPGIKSGKTIGIDDNVSDDKGNGKVNVPVVKQIPQLPLLFP